MIYSVHYLDESGSWQTGEDMPRSMVHTEAVSTEDEIFVFFIFMMNINTKSKVYKGKLLGTHHHQSTLPTSQLAG